MNRIDANTVLALAHAQGHGWIDEAAAQRIAAGATAAVVAVAASTQQSAPGLLVEDAAGFLAVLEQLAEQPG